MRPARVLLVYDVPGWAFHAECRELAALFDRHAPGVFAAEVVPSARACAMDRSRFDVVYSSAYYDLPPAAHPKSVSQVSSCSYWTRKAWPGGWPHLGRWRYLAVKNKELSERLTAADHPQARLLYHQVDERPWLGAPATRGSGALVVGYAGHRRADKGLGILEAAVKDVPGVRLLAPTYEEGRLPWEAMPAFYGSLDAYVCMSQSGREAGPRSAIEAGMCGCAIVTTRTGQIGEMVEDGANGIVVERTVDALRGALVALRDDRERCASLGAHARETFVNAWAVPTGRAWVDFFREIVEDRS